MNKFFGPVGYINTADGSETGKYEGVLTEVNYYGDILKNTKRYQPGEDLNDDLNISNIISIVADAFAFQNFQFMRYIKWMGAYWKITSVEVQRPRLILTIGGVYNGVTVIAPPEAESTAGDS